MSLRRTALSRKSELRRTPMAPRRTALRAKRVKAIARPKYTGPSPSQRNLVLERAQRCCEMCGLQLHDGTQWFRPHSLHHRRARGRGGSRWPGINLPSNILLLCGSATTPGGCHTKVEAGRTIAYDNGWLVHHGTDSATVPVLLGRFQVPVLLTEDGEYAEVAA